jgi:hypothetical protein
LPTELNNLHLAFLEAPKIPAVDSHCMKRSGYQQSAWWEAVSNSCDFATARALEVQHTPHLDVSKILKSAVPVGSIKER